MKTIFTTLQLGVSQLKNRFVMAPMTRSRATNEHADALTVLYYAQRASAGLIISEGIPTSQQGTGYLFNPGIYLDSQGEAWKPVTKSVHGQGGKIFAQLWHVGRVSHNSLLPQGSSPVSSVAKQGGSAYAWDENHQPAALAASQPRALATEEIADIITEFCQAAINAIAAGFDGVEIHAANGYLIEQFINPALNVREDHYGGQTLQNRTRLLMDITDAIADEIGRQKVGVRLSPYNTLQDMPEFTDTLETYLHIGQELNRRQIAYVHLMVESPLPFAQLLNEFRNVWQGPLILAGGIDAQRAESLIAEGHAELVAFGSAFIANPDFVARIKHGWPLETAKKSSYYGGGAEGYTDYPFYQQAASTRDH